MDLISFKKAQNVQKQLDQAIAAGDQLAEVQQARVNATGKVYTNLKERLDTEVGNTKSVVEEVARKLEDSESQTQTLTYGLNVLNSDQPSPVKVEFYGNTLVNLLGNFINRFSTLNRVNETTEKVLFGNSALVIDNSSYPYDGIRLNGIEEGKFYLVSAYVNIERNNTNTTVSMRISDYEDYATNTIISLANKSKFNEWQRLTIKFTGKNGARLLLGHFDIGDQKHFWDGISLYEIDQSTYDKIGVSLTDAQVAEMFPYVDSVQHVKNPVVRVEGENLASNISSWTHERTDVANYSDGGITWSNVSGFNLAIVPTKLIKNQPYSISFDLEGDSTSFAIQDSSSGATIGAATSSNGKASFTFTPSANYNNFRVRVVSSSGSGQKKLSNFILNLGSKPKPYVPYNPSYIYAETVLAGLPNSDKKDILYKNESLNRWEVKREFITDYVMDGSLGWGFIENKTDYKSLTVNLPASGKAYSNEITIKYDGKPLVSGTDYNTYIVGADRTRIGTGLTTLNITVANADSGWLETQTPTTDMIKVYFNGWKYTGDGTTHSWVSIVDGSAPATNTIDYVKANQANGYKNYFLTYQLAKPVTEPVTVEGDLSIQGNAQVSVGEGVIVREVANLIQANSGTSYHINFKDGASPEIIPDGSQLNNRVAEIIHIYKNGEIDTHNWTITYQPPYSYGNYRAYIDAELYDPTATYTVTYEILDKHDFTTNLNEVKATYQSSMKSSFQQVVAKQSDIATDVSIHARSIIDLYAKLKAMEV